MLHYSSSAMLPAITYLQYSTQGRAMWCNLSNQQSHLVADITLLVCYRSAHQLVSDVWVWTHIRTLNTAISTVYLKTSLQIPLRSIMIKFHQITHPLTVPWRINEQEGFVEMMDLYMSFLLMWQSAFICQVLHFLDQRRTFLSNDWFYTKMY